MIRMIESTRENETVEHVMEKVDLLCSVTGYSGSEMADSRRNRQIRRELDDLDAISSVQPKRIQQIDQSSKWKVLVKKAIRKLVAWYAADIVEQQNAYNDAVCRNLSGMNARVCKLEEASDEESCRRYEDFCAEMKERFCAEDKEKRERYALYADLLSGGEGAVLNIGCESGGFPEFMADSRVYGIVQNAAVFETLLQRGQNVFLTDPLTHLACLEDDSFDGIFIELDAVDISKEHLLALCMQAHKRIRKNGVMIVEAHSRSTLCYRSAEDIFCRTCMPPKALKCFLEYAGFQTDSGPGAGEFHPEGENPEEDFYYIICYNRKQG